MFRADTMKEGKWAGAQRYGFVSTLNVLP